MSVAWDVIKPALVTFIEATGAVLPDHVVWEREAHGFAYEDVIELRISEERAIGYDDVEDVEVAPGAFAPRITGVREFTLSIRLSSRSELTAARNGLERIRACFHHPRLLQILDEAGVSFLATETIQTFDERTEQRWESVGVLDVRLGVVSELFEPELDASAEPLEGVGVSVAGQTLSIPE